MAIDDWLGPLIGGAMVAPFVIAYAVELARKEEWEMSDAWRDIESAPPRQSVVVLMPSGGKSIGKLWDGRWLVGGHDESTPVGWMPLPKAPML